MKFVEVRSRGPALCNPWLGDADGLHDHGHWLATEREGLQADSGSMTFRNFTDASGVAWSVWDVRPEGSDRRRGKERRSRGIDDPGVDPPVIDERLGRERRRRRDQEAPRVRLREVLSEGWLAFESTSERRRLSPIPPRWESASESELADLCARASAARSLRRKS